MSDTLRLAILILFAIFDVMVWMLVPYLSGRYARSKGYDFWWAFGFAIPLSIIVPLVILALPRRDQPARGGQIARDAI